MCFPLPLKTNIQKSAKEEIPTFSVDPDGNLLTDGRFDYTWNAENRLFEIVEDGKQKLEFVYDHMGRRTIKKVYSWTGTDWQLDKTITFAYDNYNEIARFEDGSLAKSYIWGEDLSGSLQGAGGVGGLLLVADSTNTYAPVYDANGNVTGYVDAATGAQVAEFNYSPFGCTITKSGPKADDLDYKFSTKPQDEETGLVYYIHRYLDVELGRWVSRDSIDEHGGLNICGFVENDGVGKWDYLGYVAAELYHLHGSKEQRITVEWTAGAKSDFTVKNISELEEKIDKLSDANEMGFIEGFVFWLVTPESTRKRYNCERKITYMEIEGHGGAMGTDNASQNEFYVKVAEALIDHLESRSFIYYDGCQTAGTSMLKNFREVPDPDSLARSPAAKLSVLFTKTETKVQGNFNNVLGLNIGIGETGPWFGTDNRDRFQLFKKKGTYLNGQLIENDYE